jgi:hypothetical protein
MTGGAGDSLPAASGRISDLMSRVAASTIQRTAPAILAAVLLTGCTMCPDPFDYSGPVPNGSPPQNDFRARSNGILPLSAAPVPWPPLVKSDAEHGVRPAGGRRPDDSKATPPVAQAAFTKGEPVGDASDSPAESGTGVTPPLADDADSPPTPPPAIDESWTDLEPTGTEAESESAPATIVEPAPVTPIPAAPLAETPGWRPRR